MHPDKLAKLAEVSRNLSTYEELEDLLQVIVRVAAELTGGEGSSLLLFDQEDAVLRYVALSWCSPDSTLREIVEAVPVSLERGVAGWVMRKKQSVNVRQSGSDLLVHPQVAAQMRAPVHAVAAVPLVYHGLPIGVLETFNHPDGVFEDEAVEILETLASLSAVAIYNGHLLHRMQRAYESLADLDQMKSDFIAIASHELRTPLGVIIGHTSILQEIADREMREHLGVIERNARQLSEVVENMTAINEIEALEADNLAAPVRLNAFIRNTVQTFLQEAGSLKLALQVDIPEASIHARIEPDKLAIVLNNLVRNAIAFTVGTKGGKVLVQLRRKDDMAVIAVIDNGIGIPEKDLERVFDLFYQVEGHLRRKHGGMGVGLTTAKYLVEQVGGKIRVESIEGQGSCFTFSLPVSAADIDSTASLG